MCSFFFWFKPLEILKKVDKKFNKDFSLLFDGSIQKEERENIITRFKENPSVLPFFALVR